jgi:hypothetical protein
MLDRMHIEIAKQQERTKAALEKIQHASCTFNPFSSIII